MHFFTRSWYPFSLLSLRETKGLTPFSLTPFSPGSTAANYCLVYNFYSGVSNPTSCSVPSSGSTGNNGNVMGYFFQDTTNSSQGHTAAYTYDYLNRLTTAVATGSSTYNLTFSYDRYGNMTCVTNGSTNGPCPNVAFSSSTNQISTSGYTYDAAGDLTVDQATTPVNTYSWDAEGRMSQVSQGGSTYTTQTYNAFGQGVSTVYPVYSNHTVAGVFDPAGRELGHYNGQTGGYWDRNVLLGGRIVAQEQSSDTYFLHANTLGSDTQVTSHAGSVLMDLVYYPWGQTWQISGSEVDIHFAGFEQSGGAFNATPNRAYANNRGQWLTPDLLGGDASNPQSFNRYAYVLNNPTANIDPSGLWCIFPPAGGRGCGSDWGLGMGPFGGSTFSDSGDPGSGSGSGNSSIVASMGAGGIGIGGSGMGSGPLSGDYGVGLPPLGPASGPPCDFGTCGGPTINPYSTDPVSAPAGSPYDYVMQTFVAWPFLPNALAQAPRGGVPADGPLTGPSFGSPLATTSCSAYSSGGRPDLTWICGFFKNTPTNNFIRGCLQANFIGYHGIGVYNESPLLATLFFGPTGTLATAGYGASTHTYCISRGILYGQ